MIAVTGANGLLGSFIIRRLIEAGEPFVALKRQSSSTVLLDDIQDKIIWRNADVLDPVALHEALTDVTGIIHAAAMVSFRARTRQAMLQANIEGTKNVVDACLMHNIKRLLHVSSVAALGRTHQQTVVNESSTWTESPLNTLYGESKYKAELEVFRGQEEGLSTVMVNPSVILARGNWDKSSAKMFSYIQREGLFYTAGSFNYVDVRDVADIIYTLYHASFEGERFIINAGMTSYEDFFKRAAEKIGVRPARFRVSKKILTAVAFFENIRSLLSGTDPLITREMVRLADTSILFDNAKLKSKLNYPFRPLDETLTWCAEFYRKQSELKN
jgi:dihydroflavonol-4-reductase